MSYAAPRSTGYPSVEVCQIVGITYRCLDYWTRTDLIHATQEANGSGTRRAYSYRDMLDLFIIKAMLDAGIYLPAARKVMRVLQAHKGLNFTNLTLVMCEDRVHLCGQDELMDVVRSATGMLNVLPLSGITEALDDRLHADQLVDVAHR